MKDSIIVYSQPSCGMCNMIKQLLKNCGVEFTVIEDINVMKEKGIRRTPTVVINDQIFDTPKEARDFIIKNYSNKEENNN